jgi:hypothetical protein
MTRGAGDLAGRFIVDALQGRDIDGTGEAMVSERDLPAL